MKPDLLTQIFGFLSTFARFIGQAVVDLVHYILPSVKTLDTLAEPIGYLVYAPRLPRINCCAAQCLCQLVQKVLRADRLKLFDGVTPALGNVRHPARVPDGYRDVVLSICS